MNRKDRISYLKSRIKVLESWVNGPKEDTLGLKSFGAETIKHYKQELKELEDND